VTLTIKTIEARVYRAPIAREIRTSFGVMRNRPLVLLRVEDQDGREGWGEIWCNFPISGAEHRARMLAEHAAPLLEGQSFEHPRDAYAHLERRLHILALQTAEFGTIAQITAGIDLTLHDLAARRAGVPLWKYLGGARDSVPVYTSGMGPEAEVALGQIGVLHGCRAFKLKIGFGRERDLAAIAALRRAIGADAAMMVDANQAWTLDEALAMADALAPFKLAWLEEPLAADRPWPEWQALVARSATPIAGGENLRGVDQFDAALQAGAFAVVQPDAAKWGGFTGCLAVARKWIAAGRTYCPHYLGGGLGLMASAHLLAAVGGPGLLEFDAQENPLRDAIAADFPRVRDGALRLPDRPGLGIVPDLAAIERYRVAI
jgi:L-alanine-DL-glutamate epimerase-like enolase superfamily enzyme